MNNAIKTTNSCTRIADVIKINAKVVPRPKAMYSSALFIARQDGLVAIAQIPIIGRPSTQSHSIATYKFSIATHFLAPKQRADLRPQRRGSIDHDHHNSACTCEDKRSSSTIEPSARRAGEIILG